MGTFGGFLRLDPTVRCWSRDRRNIAVIDSREATVGARPGARSGPRVMVAGPGLGRVSDHLLESSQDYQGRA